MRYPSVKFLERLSFRSIQPDMLADYAYALISCQGPASVVSGEWFRMVDVMCGRKIEELRYEINSRLNDGVNAGPLLHALGVIDGADNLSTDTRVVDIDLSSLSQLSTHELVKLHSQGRMFNELRRSRKLEDFTRSHYWRIVNELLKRTQDKALAKILFLAECLEAEGYAHILGMPYKIGDRPDPFDVADYKTDDELFEHIRLLSEKNDFIAREELTGIADHIQMTIVESGKIAEHMPLVNAILSTGMPGFNYPGIEKAFEETTKALAKSDTVSSLELAPAYHTLWTLTLKPTYLRLFQKTVRHCYFTLANGKTYPDLGVNVNDRRSLSNAIRFIDENRQTLWVLNEKYDVDKVMRKYATA